VIAPSHDGVRRPRGSVTPAAAWQVQGPNSPPRNRCRVRWLELWHVDKEAALSGAVFDCRAEHFTLTGKAAYSLSSYSVVLGGRQWGWGSVAGRVEPLGCGFLLLASHLVVG
jgi:hypothetical protein